MLFGVYPPSDYSKIPVHFKSYSNSYKRKTYTKYTIVLVNIMKNSFL